MRYEIGAGKRRDTSHDNYSCEVYGCDERLATRVRAETERTADLAGYSGRRAKKKTAVHQRGGTAVIYTQ